MSSRGYTNQENGPAVTKPEMAVGQKKKRTVLGVLSENDQHSRTLGEQCSFPDSSMNTGLTGCSGYDLSVEEQAVGVSAVEDMDATDSTLLEENSATPTNSCANTSMQSLEEELLAVQDELCVPEYTEDIYLHLRKREVCTSHVLNVVKVRTCKCSLQCWLTLVTVKVRWLTTSLHQGAGR